MLGLGTGIVKGGGRASNLGIITDNLVLKHNYDAKQVHQVSTGAADINADADANEYINVGTISLGDAGENDVTMCAWVFPTVWANNGGVVSQRTNAGDKEGLLLQGNSAGGFKSTFDSGGSTAQVIGTTGKATHQWYHVCATWDRSGDQSLYVNGVLEGSNSISGHASVDISHSEDVMIGRAMNNIDFRGYICNVGYWNTPLSAIQVKSIMWKQYADLTTTEKGSIVGWWNLDSQVGSDGNAGTGYVLNEVAGAGSTTNIGTLT